MARTRFAILEAPSVLGLWPSGVERLPDALLRAGLAERLDAGRAGRIEPPAYEPNRDPQTLLLNPHGIARYSVDLADAIADLLTLGEFPIVLGGDCSILLGCLLALRRLGRPGLLFLDGHADFYQPEAEPKGEVASMELALATGRGPDVLANLEGKGPLVRDADVVAMGRRDGQDTEACGSQRIEETGIEVIDFARLQVEGIGAVTERAIRRLTLPGLERFWIHLDADVLDDRLMPAVDYRMPGGLSWNELTELLRAAMASDKVAGMDVTTFNPTLDQDGSIAAALADALAQGMRR